MTEQEAIERLRCEVELLRVLDTMNTRELADAITITLKALEKQINDRWIPVSERLPSNIEEVIACDNDGIIVTGYIKKRIGYYVCEHLPFITEDIIAWRSLPEPYKERE